MMLLKNVLHTLMLILISTSFFLAQSFKNSQLKYSKVKDAYDTKWPDLKQALIDEKINPNEYDIYLRAFKHEQLLEIWVKNKLDTKYQLFKSYKICSSSGVLGPKRREGDGQVPEGFYQIDLFNPTSNYYISMRVNYPNKSDMILKEDKNAGGAIMIHGECVTIGCLPMTNDKIKEIYVLCLEVKNRNGAIPIDIFPMKLTKENLALLSTKYTEDKLSFWNTLKPGFDYFEEHKQPAKMKVDKNGKYYKEN